MSDLFCSRLEEREAFTDRRMSVHPADDGPGLRWRWGKSRGAAPFAGVGSPLTGTKAIGLELSMRPTSTLHGMSTGKKKRSGSRLASTEFDEPIARGRTDVRGWKGIRESEPCAHARGHLSFVGTVIGLAAAWAGFRSDVPASCRRTRTWSWAIMKAP